MQGWAARRRRLAAIFSEIFAGEKFQRGRTHSERRKAQTDKNAEKKPSVSFLRFSAFVLRPSAVRNPLWGF